MSPWGGTHRAYQPSPRMWGLLPPLGDCKPAAVSTGCTHLLEPVLRLRDVPGSRPPEQVPLCEAATSSRGQSFAVLCYWPLCRGREHTCSPLSARGGGRGPFLLRGGLKCAGAGGVWHLGRWPSGARWRQGCGALPGPPASPLTGRLSPCARGVQTRPVGKPPTEPRPNAAGCEWHLWAWGSQGSWRLPPAPARCLGHRAWLRYRHAERVARPPASSPCAWRGLSALRARTPLPLPPASGFSLQPPGPWPQKAALGSRGPETREQSTHLNSLNPVNSPATRPRNLVGPRGNVFSCARQLKANSIGLGLFICAWIC